MSKKLELPSKEELENKYEELITIASVARYYNTSSPTVKKWLKTYGIRIKPQQEASRLINNKLFSKGITRDQLYDLYVIQKLPSNEVCTKLGIAGSSLGPMLAKHNIEKRSHSETCSISRIDSFGKQGKYVSKDELEKAYDELKNLALVGERFGIGIQLVSRLCKEYGIKVLSTRSRAEEELYQFCLEIAPEYDWIINNKTIINPYEIDIYCDELKFAIEYCGLYWHSEGFGEKKPNYHYDKYKRCKDKGITLLTIFETDDLEKVKEIIRHKIGKSSNKLYARKCIVKEIEMPIAKAFHEKYHMNGYVGSNKSYGIFHDNELLQVVSFGKSRFNKGYEWECTRASIKYDISIIGGMSKIFKYFINDVKPKSLITYSDLRFGEGNVYTKCGMKLIKTSSPNYWYYHPSDYTIMGLQSRVKYQKHKLEKILEYYNKEYSEFSNMKNNGFDRIWDCGNNVYVWPAK